MRKLLWLPESRRDIKRLSDFIEPHNALAAAKAVNVVVTSARRLLELPELGRPMHDGQGTRELFVPFGMGHYVLRYRFNDMQILILRIWHSREDRFQ